MTEILTESFCERCGTRYTFESSAPRKSRIGRVRMAAKGVKNFVMSDDASLSEAMADARGEEELSATAHQLDAFHKTFNFCLTCRQYTCGDCWNPTEGRCLTCAPMAGIADPAFAASPVVVAPTNGANGHQHEPAVAADEAWPEVDLSRERLARALGTDAAFAAAAAAEDEVPSQVEVDAANDAFADASIEEVDEPEAVAAAVEPDVEESSIFEPDIEETSVLEPEAIETSVLEPEVEAPSFAADEASAYDPDDPWLGTDPAVATVAATFDPTPEDAPAVDAASVAEADAEFEAQASAAEQDATVEAVMDPALDYDADDADGLDGVEPGQSLEDAVAAYEARLAAEEREREAMPAAEPVAGAFAEATLEPELEAQVNEPVAAHEPEAVAEIEIEPAVEPIAAFEPEVEPIGALEPEPDVVVAEPVAEVEPAYAEVEAEPEAPIAAMAAAAAVAHAVEPEEVVEPEAVVLAPEAVVLAPEPEPVVAAPEAVVEPEPVAPSIAASEADLAWPAADLSRQPAPVSDEDIDAALLLAMAGGRAEPDAEPEPVAAEAEPEPVAAEPEPVAAETAPEPVVAQPEPEPAVAEPVAPEPEPVAAAAEPEPRVDVVPQPTWPTPAAPDPQPPTTPAQTPGPDGANPWLMVAPAEEATGRPDPQWPETPVWRAGARNTDAPTTLAGRTLLPQPDSSALWAASAQQVLSGTPADIAAAAAVAQPCVQCGLSLSANARFCRRCGTRQG